MQIEIGIGIKWKWDKSENKSRNKIQTKIKWNKITWHKVNITNQIACK